MKYFVFFVLLSLKVVAQFNQIIPLDKADSLYQIGNFKAAVNEYAKDNSLEAQHKIARAYNAMGNTAKAIVQYQSVVKKDSKNTLVKFELGKLLDKSKKYGDAIILFEELTALEKNNPEFYYYLGKVKQSNLDFEQGNKALKKAINLDSGHLKSIYLLGKYYVSMDATSEALEILGLGLKTAPEDVALINLKALAYFNDGQYEKSAPLFERLVALGEKKPFVYKKLGYSHFANWDFDLAKIAYKKLLGITNFEADAYYGLSEIFLKEQKLDSAEVYMKKSIEERRYILDDEYRNLGRIARLQNDLKKSLDYYTIAWKENPENHLAYWQVCILADAYYKDPETKLRYYERLVANYKNLAPYLKERADKRIKELKTEIHFKANR